VHLANTAAIQRYKGLKYTDDDSDARWLAHPLRLESCPGLYLSERITASTRSIAQAKPAGTPKNHKSVKHSESVYRNTGQALSANRIKQLKVEDIDGMQSASDLTLAIKANLSVLRSADEQVQILEQGWGASETEARVQLS